MVEGHNEDHTGPLLASLRGLFPDRQLPHGTFVALAEEFGGLSPVRPPGCHTGECELGK